MMVLPEWIFGSAAKAVYGAAPGIVGMITGTLALLRTYATDRIILRFWFKGFRKMVCQDSETGSEYEAPAIQFTVTNQGKRPVTLAHFLCQLASDDGYQKTYKEKFAPVTLGQGEAKSAWVELPDIPSINLKNAHFTSASAVDTRGKLWTPSRSELAQFREQSKLVWPATALRDGVNFQGRNEGRQVQ